ncbi:hypothetical protein [Dietzia sp. SYD-A1]|uniref:hypothetical protein n=1 Tax=Dietzia sp. SYD-A1 TaxID=2780141 RepID=UPI00189126D7|nr:hypothetical protein [Dietzia sp. SYD-A1]
MTVFTTPRLAGLSAATAAVLLLVGCSPGSDGGDDGEFDVANGVATTYEFPNVPAVTAPPANATLGDEDQELGEVGADPNIPYTAEVTPIGADWMIAAEWRDDETVWAAFDPADGVVKTRITTGHGIWDDVVHLFTTDTPADPQAVAFEVWTPRGSRGQADYTVSTYSGNLLEPDEVLLPRHVRFHSREGSHTISGAGRFMTSWDDQLFGPRVVDLDRGVLSGEQQIIGCGPYTWPVGDKIYSVCERSRELLELTIDDEGRISESGRSKVLPEGFTASREAHFADDVESGFLINEAGEAYLFDFSSGLPTDEVRPLGNVGRDGGRFYTNGIRPDGEQFFVEYTDSDIHPHSANGGDVVRVRLFDVDGARETQNLDLEKLGLDSIDSVSYNLDGSVLYVLGTAPGTADDEGEDLPTIVGVDPATGEVVSTATITGHAGGSDGVSGVRAPERRVA